METQPTSGACTHLPPQQRTIFTKVECRQFIIETKHFLPVQNDNFGESCSHGPVCLRQSRGDDVTVRYHVLGARYCNWFDSMGQISNPELSIKKKLFFSSIEVEISNFKRDFNMCRFSNAVFLVLLLISTEPPSGHIVHCGKKMFRNTKSR